ncbi:hypothetical protein BDV93DRAFT_610729 [Ceratobasidium sp. AG-I]|nr:hypothetical protein BDV93DRAFT_610729 [Ceratobasidium sp. AG-I]
MFQSQHAGASQPNAFSIDSLNQEQKYVPGYLLSTTQGKSVAGFSSYNNPPLLPEPVSREHAPATPFGTGSLYSRPPPKSRDRTAPIVDNDAPPTESLLDGSNFNFSQHQHQHQSQSSRAAPSVSVPGSSSNPTGLHAHTGGVALTVSGFYPDRAHGVIAQFVAIGDCAPPEMAPEGGNWFRITYVNSWDAARAVRRDGDVINGDMMIAVRLVDPSQASLFGDALAPRMVTSSSPPEPSPKSPNMIPSSSGFPTFGRSATLVPSTSAFRSTAPASAQARPTAATAPGADWGVRNQQEGAEKEGAQQQGIIGKVSDMIFGW